MTTIEDVSATPGMTAFFADDQAAIAAGAEPDGFAYAGEPETPGFDRIREPGEAVLVELALGDGRVVRGDCAAVQYAGVGERDPVFRADDHVELVEGDLRDALVGRPADSLEQNAAVLEELDCHSAVEYGVSQALVAAAAAAAETTRTRVLAEALDTEPATEPLPVFGQSGSDRRRGAEKMLLKRVDVLPHGLFNSLETVGPDGRRLVEYLSWLADRTTELGDHEYDPRFHVDVYGMLGELFEPPYDRSAVIEYVDDLRQAAAPYSLQLEEPVLADSREAQIAAMRSLRDGLAAADVPVDLVADEWCDRREDVEAFVDAGAADVVQVKSPDVGSLLESGRAVRYCQDTDVRAYLGGTCNETTTSARATVHVGLATDAAQLLAKPGMGFDEGYAIVTNEMRRTLARHRRTQPNRL
ncbi:methylaspartate ammonia-lyase [Natronobacterium gregoryi]|uniref:methylaspartate ammonia-lyase n=2 Tax=Natronobacterium gregoryi TaxID=44930 RepID=L0AJX2_NATGS|nr:methylaspartate ammonia-lyase [Natronobacterium gregoryi]AFZ73360.1 methylaspartate ammonia-lyase [Natronobacterium gregoryi SP2]ELY68557.1 methylaspartate ammonia-lyase [Natronobacterium gregoryi SP2]PLK19642.1 methylaspartate ammonia-lyase [Natronobacterium gregoryi SP2]SFI74062.1 methylaspartate ammonia-lyase [Natronobacterium gregoryi]